MLYYLKRKNAMIDGSGFYGWWVLSKKFLFVFCAANDDLI
jgi:hypothetical protein